MSLSLALFLSIASSRIAQTRCVGPHRLRLPRTKTKTDYIQWQNKAANYLHWKICREYKIKTADRWCEHQPDTVAEYDKLTKALETSTFKKTRRQPSLEQHTFYGECCQSSRKHQLSSSALGP